MVDGTPRQRKRVVAVLAGAGAVLVAASLVLVLATSNTTERVAANARDLHWANAAQGSASLVRAANAQAVFFAVDFAAGFAPRSALDDAIAEAEAAIDNFEAIGAAAEAEIAGPAITAAMKEFALTARRVIEQADAGQAELALEGNATMVEDSFQVLAALLDSRLGTIQTEISDSEGTAGRVSSVTRLFVTLLIPLFALVVYRTMVKRQLRDRRIQFEAKLKAEKEVSRAKDEFIAGLSHEFRTPLTSIYGFSEILIEQGIVDPESSLELIGLINSESAELSRMVEDLLMAARLEAGALTIQRLSAEIAGEVEAVLAPLRRTRHDIPAEIENALIWADPLRFRQVVRNLVSNAIKHGGPVIGIRGRKVRDAYLLSVVDNGPGVPDEIATRLFERFVHDGRRALLTGSVGLGLNIARSLALEMDGDLTYERIGASTVFTVRIPLAEAAPSGAWVPVAEAS